MENILKAINAFVNPTIANAQWQKWWTGFNIFWLIFGVTILFLIIRWVVNWREEKLASAGNAQQNANEEAGAVKPEKQPVNNEIKNKKSKKNPKSARKNKIVFSKSNAKCALYTTGLIKDRFTMHMSHIRIWLRK